MGYLPADRDLRYTSGATELGIRARPADAPQNLPAFLGDERVDAAGPAVTQLGHVPVRGRLADFGVLPTKNRLGGEASAPGTPLESGAPGP